MAASVKLYGDTYNYTISNITNSITVTPSNRNSRYGAVYTTKPTIKINAKHACTRYIWIDGNGISTSSKPLVCYKVVFSSSSTTGTVTEVSATNTQPLGAIADGGLVGYQRASATVSNGIVVLISTTASESGAFDSAYASITINASGWNPSAPTIDRYDLTQATPDSTIFGYIANYAKAFWHAKGNTTWSYSLNTVSGTISPKQTLTLSANGESATSATNQGERSVTLPSKLVTSTTVTATAKLTNILGGSATSTKPVTVQPYSPPIAKSLAVGRVTVNNEKHASMSIGWSVNELNKQSTASQSIMSGAITCTWECEDLSNEGVLFSSGEFDIVSDGDAMTVLTDTATATLVDTSGNENDVYDPDKSFRFTAYITDRIGGTSLTVSAILASEFYLICAREGGRGIGFGMVPPDDAMHVNMPATFYDNVEMNGAGVAIGTTATDGEFTVSNDLIPRLRGSADQGTGVTWRTVYEDAPYGDMAIEFGVGTGASSRGIWCTAYNGGAGHWLINENAAGEAFIQGKKVRGSTRVWSGAVYMNDTQNVTWTDDGLWSSVSLIWSAYSGGAAQNYQWVVYTVPRGFIANHAGVGHTIFMGGSKYNPMGCKYVYISLNKITGNADNDDTGTAASGVKYQNNYYVLREVWLNY